MSRLSRSIAGRVALVAGAAGGMGRAIAHPFSDGAAVAVAEITGWVLDGSDPEAVGEALVTHASFPHLLETKQRSARRRSAATATYCNCAVLSVDGGLTVRDT